MADRCFESIVVKALEHTWVKRHQTLDFQGIPGIFEAPARTACVDACPCMCGPPGKLLQRFASKVDSLVKTFARQASKKARVQLGCGELVLAMVGQQRGDAQVDSDASLGSVLLEASPLQSVRWLHIASHSFSPWQSLEEEPVNLLGEMKLKVRGKFFTRVQMAQSADLAATRWVGCLCEVMFSQTPLGEFRPNESRVKKLPATTGLLWHPWCKRSRKSRKQDFGWASRMTKTQTEVVQIFPCGEGGAAVSDEGPLQLEEDCDELGDHPPDGEQDPGALLGSLDEAWNEHSLEASDDEASVDDAIDVALVTWTVQLLRLM